MWTLQEQVQGTNRCVYAETERQRERDNVELQTHGDRKLVISEKFEISKIV